MLLTRPPGHQNGRVPSDSELKFGTAFLTMHANYPAHLHPPLQHPIWNRFQITIL